MYKILFLTGGGDEGKKNLRQTPGGKGTFLDGKYQFFVNEEIEDPDFLIVRGKAIRKETTFHVSPKNTILMTSEPYTVLSYARKYCMQFGLVCSCQENLKLPNVIYTPAMLPWFVGIEFSGEGNIIHRDYDTFRKDDPIQKTKLISVVTSNKAFTKGHLERLSFVEKLQNYYGDRIDVFGRGFHSFGDKWDVLAPYKYHVAIENSSSKYYWTEKLSDCYLTETYPFYYGCTNINDYFPDKTGVTTIDVHNFEQSVRLIDEAIQAQMYEKNLSTLKQCKDLVLNDYNMFNYAVSLCEKLDPMARKETIKFKPASHYIDLHNFYLYTMERSIFKVRRNVEEWFEKLIK